MVSFSEGIARSALAAGNDRLQESRAIRFFHERDQLAVSTWASTTRILHANSLSAITGCVLPESVSGRLAIHWSLPLLEDTEYPLEHQRRVESVLETHYPSWGPLMGI